MGCSLMDDYIVADCTLEVGIGYTVDCTLVVDMNYIGYMLEKVVQIDCILVVAVYLDTDSVLKYLEEELVQRGFVPSELYSEVESVLMVLELLEKVLVALFSPVLEKKREEVGLLSFVLDLISSPSNEVKQRS